MSEETKAPTPPPNGEPKDSAGKPTPPSVEPVPAKKPGDPTGSARSGAVRLLRRRYRRPLSATRKTVRRHLDSLLLRAQRADSGEDHDRGWGDRAQRRSDLAGSQLVGTRSL